MKSTSESKIINFYIVTLELITVIILKIVLYTFGLIFGSIFGFLGFWVDGLDVALDPENKGFNRIMKIIFYPIMWSIGGIFRGPVIFWQSLDYIF